MGIQIFALQVDINGKVKDKKLCTFFTSIFFITVVGYEVENDLRDFGVSLMKSYL